MATRPFNVRMDDSLQEGIDELVKTGDASNRSEWAREALAGVVELGGLQALRQALELKGRDPSLPSPHPARAQQLVRQGAKTTRSRRVEVGPCEHPVETQMRRPYSTTCGKCGAVLEEREPAPTEVRRLGARVAARR